MTDAFQAVLGEPSSRPGAGNDHLTSVSQVLSTPRKHVVKQKVIFAETHDGTVPGYARYWGGVGGCMVPSWSLTLSARYKTQQLKSSD